MLVLTRKLGQSLLLGEDIEVTVLRIEGEQVRLGIKAPRQVCVLRRELVEEVRAETQDAKATTQTSLDKATALKALSARLKPKSDIQ